MYIGTAFLSDDVRKSLTELFNIPTTMKNQLKLSNPTKCQTQNNYFFQLNKKIRLLILISIII